MNLPEIRLMQAAVALAEELNYRRAAQKLNIVQSTLSKQIIELEHQLGYPLFIRSNQHVELTDAGRFFVQEARETLFHATRAVQRSRAVAQGAGSILHAGKSPYIDPYITTSLSSITLPLYPDLRIEFLSALSADLEMKVMDGKLDFAIVMGTSKDPKLIQIALTTTPFYILMSSQDSLAKRYEVTLEDLDQRRWVLFERHVNPTIYERIMTEADGLGVKPTSVQHVMSAEDAAQMFEEEGLVAFLTRAGAWRVARHGLTMRPLANKKLYIQTALVARSENDSRLLSEVVRALRRKLDGPSPRQMTLRRVS